LQNETEWEPFWKQYSKVIKVSERSGLCFFGEFAESEGKKVRNFGRFCKQGKIEQVTPFSVVEERE
jgi:hypothetical protein